MNAFAPSISSRESVRSLGFQRASIALGLLLVACLAAMISHPPHGAEAPTRVPSAGSLTHRRETRPTTAHGAKVGGSSTARIRRWPITLITADAISAEEDAAPQPQVIETVLAVEIVPLATLRPTTPSRP